MIPDYNRNVFPSYMCQQDGDIEISLGNTQCYYQGEWKHVNNSYYFSNLPNLKKFSERFILQIFLDFSFLAKTITLPSLKLIALDIFWATQSQERDWSIFFERETWREEKACVVWLGGRETGEIVTVQTFKRKKNSLQDEPWSMAIFRLALFMMRKMNILKCQRRNGNGS